MSEINRIYQAQPVIRYPNQKVNLTPRTVEIKKIPEPPPWYEVPLILLLRSLDKANDQFTKFIMPPSTKPTQSSSPVQSLPADLHAVPSYHQTIPAAVLL